LTRRVAHPAVATAVVAARAVASSSVFSTVSTAVSNAATTTAAAASSVGAAVANTYQAVGNQILKVAVQVDTLKPGGGAIKAATDFAQGAISRTSPVTNNYNLAGRSLRLGYELAKALF
jgi:hypothetical protein